MTERNRNKQKKTKTKKQNKCILRRNTCPQAELGRLNFLINASGTFSPFYVKLNSFRNHMCEVNSGTQGRDGQTWQNGMARHGKMRSH